MTSIPIALYIYPGNTGAPLWQKIIDQQNLHTNVQFICKINPSSGPGTAVDQNFVTWINNLKAAGAIVLGYVSTGYGRDSTKSVAISNGKIDSYYSWYNIDGIFFDEMDNTTAHIDYYQQVSAYARSKGAKMLMGNPGTGLDPAYDGIMDWYEIREGNGMPTVSELQSDAAGFTKSLTYYNAKATPALDITLLQATLQIVDGAWITDDGADGNPYNSLPSYFAAEVAAMDTGNPLDQGTKLNLLWIPPANNGGSLITGYKIERSSDNGVSWVAIVSNTGNVLTTYTDMHLTPNTTYTYRISALNGMGSSQPSTPASGTTKSGTISPPPTVTVPDSPTGLTVTPA